MSFKNKLKKGIKFIVRAHHEKTYIPITQTIPSGNLLNNKIAFITGGTSGIGLSIAKELLANGCKVIICGSNQEKLDNALKVLNNNAKGIAINISKIEGLENRINHAINIFPEQRIDILINCAGVVGTQQFGSISEAEYDRIMDTNLKGTFFVSQIICNHMIKSGIKGHVLNVSSSSALRPAKDPYQISKWAINGFTKGLADIMISHGIVVNAIAPGQTATPMLNKDNHDSIYHSDCPAGRYVTPEEIAKLATFMVSDMGNMIVGDVFYITGGSGTISLHR